MDYTEQLTKEALKEGRKERQKLIIDFDEAVKEQRSEPIIVKFRGEQYELPPVAPAWLPLFINRYSQNGEVDDNHNLELIERLLGKEFADKIIDAGNFVSFELVNEKILIPVMNHWGIEMEDTSKNGTAPSS